MVVAQLLPSASFSFCHPMRMLISHFRAKRRRVFAVALGGVFYVTLLIMGSQPEMASKLGLGLFNDKVLHLLAYGALAGFLFLGLPQAPLRRSLYVIGAVAVLGAADELFQSTLPHRDADVLDWLADIAGAISACVTLSVIRAVAYRSTAEAAPRPGVS